MRTTATLPADDTEPARGGLPGAIASEWTKFWSVRSTWWSVISAAVLMLGFATAVGASVGYGDGESGLSAQGIAVGGAFYLAQFTVIALATLFLTSEYASGSIRSSLQWVPVRNRLLLAKSVVLAPILFVLGVVLAGAGMATSSVLMDGHGRPTTAGGALSTAVGMGAYFALLGLLCLGIGMALRSTAGTMVMVFVLLLMLPMVIGSLVGDDLVNYFPGIGGINAMTNAGQPNVIFHTVSPYVPWVGVLICAGWSAAGLLAGATVLRTRDA